VGRGPVGEGWALRRLGKARLSLLRVCARFVELSWFRRSGLLRPTSLGCLSHFVPGSATLPASRCPDLPCLTLLRPALASPGSASPRPARPVGSPCFALPPLAPWPLQPCSFLVFLLQPLSSSRRSHQTPSIPRSLLASSISCCYLRGSPSQPSFPVPLAGLRSAPRLPLPSCLSRLTAPYSGRRRRVRVAASASTLAVCPPSAVPPSFRLVTGLLRASPRPVLPLAHRLFPPRAEPPDRQPSFGLRS
jgi:hypothetical protein